MSLYIYIAGWGEARKCKGKKKKGREEEKKDSDDIGAASADAMFAFS